jgi:hypothetical protein
MYLVRLIFLFQTNILSYLSILLNLFVNSIDVLYLINLSKDFLILNSVSLFILEFNSSIKIIFQEIS